MFTIADNGRISLTRGDDVQIPIFLNCGTELRPSRYELTDEDELYFALMQPSELFEDAIFKQKYTSVDKNEEGDILIDIRSEHTENLTPGKYFYQIKLKSVDSKGRDSISTVVPRTEFIIEE